MTRRSPITRLLGLGRDRRGVVSIEAVFVIPVFLVFMFGTMELGMLLWTINTLNFAVTQAARCAGVDNDAGSGTCNSVANIQTYAAAQAFALGVTSSTFTVTQGATAKCYFGSEATAWQVTANYTYQPFFGAWFSMFRIPIVAQACYPD